MHRKFWNWVKNEDGSRTLHLDGAIAEETWFGDEVTPKQFRSDLVSGEGDITVWINPRKAWRIHSARQNTSTA